MSDAAALPLLSRDKEQIERAATPIREGRGGFSILVCPREMWPAATAYLAEKSGKAVSAPRFITSGSGMVRFLAAVQGKPPSEVESIAIDGSNLEVLEAMNWNREKLTRGGHVLLWVGSADGLQSIVEHAPDAYSFRDRVVVLRGEGSAPRAWEGEEPPEIKVARLLFELPRSPEEQAEAALELSNALHTRRRLDEVMRICRAGLELIPRERYPDERHRILRGLLLSLLANALGFRGHCIDAFRHYCRALDDIGDSSSGAVARESIEVLRLDCSPLGPDGQIVDAALGTLDTSRGTALMYTILTVGVTSARTRGRFREALRRADSALGLPALTAARKAELLRHRAWCHCEAGRLDLAERDLAAAGAADLQAELRGLPNLNLSMELLVARGELSAAVRLASSSADEDLVDALASRRVATLRGVAIGQQGDVQGMLAGALSRAHDGATDLRDRLVFEEYERIRKLLPMVPADRLGEASIDALLTGMDADGGVLVDYAGADPPWYGVLFLALRARLLSLVDARKTEAVAVATEAVDQARRLWRQALPSCTRALVQCLARAGQWSGMGPEVQAALEAAREADQLRELAAVQAYDLVRLGRAGASRESLEAALSALRATFTEMDAPRVEGETWLEVAPFFPPEATFPDPVEIADRAHDLFFDMPMPEPAARCMEWLGDIHAARREPSRAQGCYQMCLNALERYGLLLRKPIVEQKLAAITGGRSSRPSSS